MTRLRRPVAVGLLTLAALSGTRAVLAPSGPETVVWVSVRDLAAGHRLTGADVRTVRWPSDTAPEGLVPDPTDQVLSSPLRRGEPITDARLIGEGALSGQPAGTVAVPVRLADAGVTAWLHPGDHVDVLAVPGAVGDTILVDSTTAAEVLVSDAVVLGIGQEGQGESPAWGSSSGIASSGRTTGLIIVAVSRSEAPRLAVGLGREVTVALTQT